MAKGHKTIQSYQDEICGPGGLKIPPGQRYDPNIATMNWLAPLWAIAFEMHRSNGKMDELRAELEYLRGQLQQNSQAGR